MALLDVLKEKFGPEFHPGLLLGQVVADDSADLKLRVDCAKTLMPYVESTLKSVEIRGNIDTNVGLLRVAMFGECEDLPLPPPATEVGYDPNTVMDVEYETED